MDEKLAFFKFFTSRSWKNLGLGTLVKSNIEQVWQILTREHVFYFNSHPIQWRIIIFRLLSSLYYRVENGFEVYLDTYFIIT